MIRSRQKIASLGVALCLASMPGILLAADKPEPVATVANQGFRISTSEGQAVVPVIASLDWSKPQPKITRAVVMFHGKGRDVEGYYRTAQEAADIAGSAGRDTVLIAPQFLDTVDIEAHHLPAEVLRWQGTDWEAGATAAAPFPLSTFDVIDALLKRLADRASFPNLKTIVVAGHSGGGQLVQRYAVVGRVAAALADVGIHLRFVIANPSSYIYFSDERPGGGGMPAPFAADSCPQFNHWKYGIVDPPAYVKLDSQNTWARLEAEYAKRDVIYLLGTADNDPHEKDLDVSCGGEAEGKSRFERGRAYYSYLHDRNRANWNQHLRFVPGVAHSAKKMFTSACGVNALFDGGRCPDQNHSARVAAWRAHCVRKLRSLYSQQQAFDFLKSA